MPAEALLSRRNCHDVGESGVMGQRVHLTISSIPKKTPPNLSLYNKRLKVPTKSIQNLANPPVKRERERERCNNI